MTEPTTSRLAALLREELAAAAPADACGWLPLLRERYGATLRAVLFYGSCLRTPHPDGVLDFYAIVDDYRDAYGSRVLARLNRMLPPNVFYLERNGARAKVAVLSQRDFERAVSPGAIRPGTWARFCQPFAVAYARDDASREAVVATAASAVRTALIRAFGLQRGDVPSRALWTGLFRETYRSELRTEQGDRASELYAAGAARYDRLLDAARPELPPVDGLFARPHRVRRVVAKAIGVVQLVKSAVTFGDWMPYALWKLERHTGTRLEPTEAQRRHPFLLGWPLVVRALARRDLR